MLWKLLLLAACAVADVEDHPPRRRREKDEPSKQRGRQNQNLALCPKCGVYHHPDSPCQNTAPPNAKPS